MLPISRSKTQINHVFTVMVAMILAVTGLVVAPITAYATAATYYIDSQSGDDSASGTSPSEAWQTLAAATNRTFAPGDQILLARGGQWEGQLAPKGSGTTGNPITITAYGVGPAPRIDGASLAGGAAVFLENQSHWVIENLDVVNNSGSDNFGSLTTDGIPRSGIQVRNSEWGSTQSGIVIRNNTVSDVNGCFHCVGIDAHINGGIVVDTTTMGADLDDVLIEGNVVTDVGRTGIVFWDASYFTTSMTTVVQSALSTGVVIRGNTVTRPDSDGILAFGTDGALLEHNVVRDAANRTIEGSSMSAAAGIWPTRAMNTIVQFNEVSGTQIHGADGQGFDVDLGSTNTIVQYNYSHDNEGGFLLMMGGYSSEVTVRYNLSVNDAWTGEKGVFVFSWGVPNETKIYNNTIVIPQGSAAKPIHCDGDAGACSDTTPGNWSFTNNIVVNEGSGDWFYPGNASTVSFASNVFYGNHPAHEPDDATVLTSNPQFMNPGATGSGFAVADSYKLQDSSPAISTGTVVVGNGGRDFFGATVSPILPPSRGFHEAALHVEPHGFIDEAVDWSLTEARSSNMVVDTTGPLSNFQGDDARFKRSNNSAGWVRWAAEPGLMLEVDTYLFNQNPSVITLVAKDAAGNPTAVPLTVSAASTTTNAWMYRGLISDPLPSGTVAVELHIAAVQAWAVQIGQITAQ